MKVIAYTRPGAGIVDIPEPQIASPTEVKIKMSYASMCGSDLHEFAGDFDYLLPGEGPVPVGHEGSGIIAELGPDATAKGLKVGDKVSFYFNNYCGTCHWCRNGQEQFCSNVEIRMAYMADYIVMDEQQVFKLKDDADLVAASIIEPVSICLRGLDLAAPVPGQSLAVFGGGGIGQVTARLAVHSGCSSVTLFEPVAAKRQVALDGGIPYAFDPITDDAYEKAMELTGGRGYDVVMECSGAQSAVESAKRIVSRGGTIVLLATYKPGAEFTMPIHKAFLDEITVVTGVMQSPYMFPRCVALYDQLGLDKLATVYGPEDFQKAIDDQSTGDTIKAVFDFTK